MAYYEILILMRTEATTDEISLVESGINDIVSEKDGTLKSFDVWGKYKLAYPIQGRSFGVYALIRYELPKEKGREFSDSLRMFFTIKAGEFVMRHSLVNLGDKGFPEYQKPESMDSGDGVGSSVDSFLKENKSMVGFVGNKDVFLEGGSTTSEEEKDSSETH